MGLQPESEGRSEAGASKSSGDTVPLAENGRDGNDPGCDVMLETRVHKMEV